MIRGTKIPHAPWHGQKKKEKMIVICRLMVIYLENPKESTRKLLQTTKEFTTMIRYKY